VHLFREPRRHARGGSAGVNAATRVALLPWRELMKASLYWGEALGHSIAERRASVANVLLTCCKRVASAKAILQTFSPFVLNNQCARRLNVLVSASCCM
jgi:hypothetical protein